MNSRRFFAGTVATVAAVTTLMAGSLALEHGAAHAQGMPVAPAHFDAKGVLPSTYTIELRKGVLATLPMGDKRDFGSVKVHELDEETGDYAVEGVLVTMDDIAQALQLIADSNQEIPYASENWRYRMVQALIEEDGGDIDAGDADNIVQVAMFGKLVYG